MAGGFGQKFDPKNKSNKKTFFSSEVYKDSLNSFPSKPDSQPTFSLRGILGLGQTVEIGKKEKSQKNWGKEFLGNINYLQQQEQSQIQGQQKELRNAIEELQKEIEKLLHSTQDLSKNVENTALLPVVEFNEYQFNFLNRIKQLIVNFRKNINQAGVWLETFNTKKKKNNRFWSMAKNKKQGGEQYLFSEEHSVSRSGS